jgi:E3 ubiquitin-protein ligase UBR4
MVSVIYGKECAATFESLSRSVQQLKATRHELLRYQQRIHQIDLTPPQDQGLLVAGQSRENRCFGCSSAFVAHIFDLIEHVVRQPLGRELLLQHGAIPELFENNLYQGTRGSRQQARKVLCLLTKDDAGATDLLNRLIRGKLEFGMQHARWLDLWSCLHNEMQLLTESCLFEDSQWEDRLRCVLQVFFSAIERHADSPVISQCIVLPSMRLLLRICKPPKDKETKDSAEPATPAADGLVEHRALASYKQWSDHRLGLHGWAAQRSQGGAPNAAQHRAFHLARKYSGLWRRGIRAKRGEAVGARSPLARFKELSWLSTLILSPCSATIRQEAKALVEVLSGASKDRAFAFLDLLYSLLPRTLGAGETASQFFALFRESVASQERKLYLTVRGFLDYVVRLIHAEAASILECERMTSTDLSQVRSRLAAHCAVQARLAAESICS